MLVDKPSVGAERRRRVPIVERSGLMRSVNDGVASFAADVRSVDGESWAFLCECGALECAAWVDLELDEYTAIRVEGGSVLAPGHIGLTLAQRARSDATGTREAARAVREQAKLQRHRARRLS